MQRRKLLPIRGSHVKRIGEQDPNRTGIIVDNYPETSSVKVHWVHDKTESVQTVDALVNGFRLGTGVIAPTTSDGRKLGEGQLTQYRKIAGQELLLVEFHESNEKRWLPYQLLSQAKDVKHELVTLKHSAAEKVRLKTLAHAITIWNENTGALSNLNIDPLPHQIHLVHHILNSGNLNWLIADDVGLGKTVETILLMSALQHRKQLKSVLLITPAGLTQQWQEEIIEKAPNLPRFNVYGTDFPTKHEHHWFKNDFVVASMDRLKNKDHLNILLDSRQYDLIIVDEAHRLSRRQYGYKLDSSERFELVAELRKQNQNGNLILLTATPHQGMQDKFIALLELLRPERKSDLLKIDVNPEVLSEFVFRNYKADVTDLDGNFVFHGKTTRSVQVQTNEQAIEFDSSLRKYLKRGYSASKALGREGNAIGFVMTVYRKLAASSVAAIHKALLNRLDRLQNQLSSLDSVDIDEDSPFQGEQEESLAQKSSEKEFFSGEIGLLKELIIDATNLLEHDNKSKQFIDTIITKILKNNPKEKVLIFTEYRSTQQYLAKTLQQKIGADSVNLIYGGMKLDERKQQIYDFENTGQFLISTEAGGEGINLQEHCHIMINYDLPWNPMRLVQRVGRLYRYGQLKRVVVFNINSSDSLDEKVLETMYGRVEAVVKDLAQVQSSEFNDALMDDILGEVSSLIDIESILENAQSEAIERTNQRINEAVEKAKESAELQRDLFQHAINSNDVRNDNPININKQHVAAFISGICELLDIEIMSKLHNDEVWQLRIPPNVMELLQTKRSRHDISFDRKIASTRANTQYIDVDSYLMKLFLSHAMNYNFKGKAAHLHAEQLAASAFMACILTWQNSVGIRKRQDFTILSMENGEIVENTEEILNWLLLPANDAENKPHSIDKRRLFQLTQAFAEKKLAVNINLHTFPEKVHWVSAAVIN
ncbi:DEAD/DEAH box helicase [Shewanella woodyi]|uniref:Helicase domain protein n=1 Tax=Shewanella woodyi (strain ATCC 51908 / MS32) TaxID=392500 RepID=B1KKL5_SHEWM|nr:helicase-related protein [Shewanella woodyi]ACA87232.1 helicase domain protein [Shewanella woodyi ATCC 51908]